MTGLEPHPIFRLPTQEEALAMGPERFEALIAERARRMMLERENPLERGFEPEIWHLVDDLLTDGHAVVLDLARVQKLMPPGRKVPANFVPKEIAGAPEIWVAGSNRSSKSEYAAKKIMKILTERENARTWCFSDKEEVSIARQQPLLWKYLPAEVKKRAEATGRRLAQGGITKVKYSLANGFTDGSFVLPNGSQNWFKNYKQEESELEGDQLDGAWLDELRNPNLLKIIRTRMGDRAGLVIVTFTSVDDNYSAIVGEYEKGSRKILEVEAELLPAKDEEGELTEEFEKVPRVCVAGPGSDGDQRANIVYFHITDNPYYGYEAALAQWKKTKQAVRFGAERFYAMYRRAIRSKILSRVYGILTGGARTQCPRFNAAVHVIEHHKIPKVGSNYHVVDPVDGRNWFMIWVRVDPKGRKFVYREWPSYSTGDRPNPSPSAYIPGIGDPGPWALPGEPADGVQGPAQKPFGFGHTRYKEEILRCEGHPEPDGVAAEPEAEAKPNKLWRKVRHHGEAKNGSTESRPTGHRGTKTPEVIQDRDMDSRYGNTPTSTKEGETTLIEQMEEIGMSFRAASGRSISEGVTLINDDLDYDEDIPLGKFSPRLARLNEPQLFVSDQCPNTIYALKEWTGKDGNKGACKDPIDDLRYFYMAGNEYVDEKAFSFQGGGSY